MGIVFGSPVTLPSWGRWVATGSYIDQLPAILTLIFVILLSLSKLMREPNWVRTPPISSLLIYNRHPMLYEDNDLSCYKNVNE